MYEQIDNYKNEISILEEIDSIRVSEIQGYQNLNNFYENRINSLELDINKKDKQLIGWKIGGFTVTLGLILFLLLK